MSRIIVAAVVAVALVCVVSAQAQEKRALELLVITAVTAEEHDAAARFYDEKAKDARAEAEWHRDMGVRYVEGAVHGSKVGVGEKAHCDKIAWLHDEMAEEYEALARSHEKKARGLEAKPGTESR